MEEKHESQFGFSKIEKPDTVYDEYIGKAIITQNIHSKGIIGILKKIDVNSDVAYFSPFIGYNGDDSAYINNESSAMLSLPLISIYPMKQTLEQYCEGYNLREREKSRK